MLFKFNVQIHDNADKTFEFLGTEFTTDVPIDTQALLNMKQEVFTYVLGNGKTLLGDYQDTVGIYTIKTEAEFSYQYIPPPSEDIVLVIIWKDVLSVIKTG